MKPHTRSSIVRVPGRYLPLALALATASLVPAAGAAEFDVGGGKLRATGNLTFGWMGRTEAQDPAFLFNPNAVLVGLQGTAVGGRNLDDGNLNFDEGDTVSMVVKGYLTLDYRRGNYGILASGMAWYDFGLTGLDAPWGNIPNNLTAGARLGTNGAQSRAKFSGVVGDNAYLYGFGHAGDVPFDWRAGYQKLDWGNRLVVLGGLRDLNALDLPGSFRPGTVAVDETRIAAPMVFAGFKPAPDWRVEGFWQIHWQRNNPHQCGTFWSAADWLAEGCDKVTLGAASDRAALATGTFIKRAPTVTPDGYGEGGAAVLYTHAPWATEFGAYIARFDSRASYWGIIKSRRTTGPPFIPGDPGGLNPKYFVQFPEGINMYALSFETKWRGGSALGELSYRPNQPLQYNSGDALAAATTNVAPTPLRASFSQVPPGGVYDSYERHQNVQLQLAVTQAFPSVLGASVFNVGAEFVYKGVPDLPDQNVTRFGRTEIYGNGPVNGVCPANNPLACTNNGFVSKNAYGIRARAVLRYPNVMPGVELVPQITYGYDIKGWSGDGGINEGRNVAALSLRANFRGGLTAEIAWWPTWGGDYFILSDRDIAQASISYRF